MKLHKPRCPHWELIQLHLEESSGCLEFQGRAEHVLLGRPRLGPRLEVGRLWLTAAPLGSLGDRTPHNPLTVKHHTDKPLCQNKVHLASGFWPPLQKKQDLGIQQPNPTANVAGFLSLLWQTDSESVVLRTPMPKSDNSVSVPGTLLCGQTDPRTVFMKLPAHQADQADEPSWAGHAAE